MWSDVKQKKLQTPAVTPQQIQLPTWKKYRIESPTNPSYHYTPGSTINIASAEPTKLEKKQEEEEEESEDQEFTYQNLIIKNPDIETSNFQTQQD
ncbi:hypothetical protein G9A89_017702 [Geosiphon pyriformis]|nr:hypothetical protein G9A89_017702 [Geosiphon pyriformis]